MTHKSPHQHASPQDTTAHKNLRRQFAGLSVAALGVVYGDIGTSPLYAMDQIVQVSGARTPTSALGAASLVIWTLTLIVAIKYAILVLRAQNDGEGGVFALYSLLRESLGRRGILLLSALILGAGLLIGDGMITPAISVLSAVEGLQVATPGLSGMVIPITLVLLIALFAVQFKGTAGIGSIFGPILSVWFVAIAGFGVLQIVHHPQILAAFNPWYGLTFLHQVGWYKAFFVLGALMLVVTGGEAMYADVGHFGSGPIRTSWFLLVFPSLLLNYLGQGAYLLSGAPIAADKLFFSIIPHNMLYPMILLATIATVIASQALISGAYTIISQAVRLGLFPRLNILHTHEDQAGQIYVPFVNWSLLFGCILLVLGFGSSAALAAAYGLAVSGVMLITSVAMFPVAQQIWGWNAKTTGAVWGFFTLINFSFFTASSLKFVEGGWVPLSVGLVVFYIMATWRWGRKATTAAYMAKSDMNMKNVIDLHRSNISYFERNAVLMSPRSLKKETDRAPALLQMLWECYGVLPRNLIFVEIKHRSMPYIHDNRYQVTVFDHDATRGSIIAITINFGFMEDPNVEAQLKEMTRLQQIDLPVDTHQWIVYVAHENLIPTDSMGRWRFLRFRLFEFLRQISRPAYYYYGLGDKVKLSVEILPVRVH